MCLYCYEDSPRQRFLFEESNDWSSINWYILSFSFPYVLTQKHKQKMYFKMNLYVTFTKKKNRSRSQLHVVCRSLYVQKSFYVLKYTVNFIFVPTWNLSCTNFNKLVSSLGEKLSFSPVITIRSACVLSREQIRLLSCENKKLQDFYMRSIAIKTLMMKKKFYEDVLFANI